MRRVMIGVEADSDDDELNDDDVLRKSGNFKPEPTPLFARPSFWSASAPLTGYHAERAEFLRSCRV